MTDEENNLLATWKSARDALSEAKEEEAKLRATVGMTIFPSADVGANTIELGGGYRCTYTKKINYNLSVPTNLKDGITINGAMEDLAEEMRLASNEGAFIFPRLVTWKPSLSVSEYKKLPDNLRAIVDRYVTTSEGAPTLEIKEPAKGKGK